MPASTCTTASTSTRRACASSAPGSRGTRSPGPSLSARRSDGGGWKTSETASEARSSALADGWSVRRRRSNIEGVPAHALDLARAERGPSGRITRVPTSSQFALQGVTVPSGSVLQLHPDDRWIDPRRGDVLRAVEVAAPTWVPALGRDVRAGARLADFHADGPRFVEHGFDGELEIDGTWIDGDAPARFHAGGRPTSFTIARPYTIGPRTWPARSRLSREPGDGWDVTLGDAVALGDVSLAEGDRVTLDHEGRPVSFWPRRSGTMTIGSVTVRLGYGSIPLTSDGNVDVERCRKLRLLA